MYSSSKILISMIKVEGLLQSINTIVMGVLNVTPDSFSDGGEFVNVEKAVSHALQMVSDGADIIDIGGESSKPRSVAISIEEEIERVLPVVVDLVKKSNVIISVDTYKPEVAKKCLEVGVNIINDITGLKNPEMRNVIAEYDATAVIMHMQKVPKNMQENPQYENVVEEIISFFKERIKLAKEDGITKIILDPGIGFGKTLEHNLEIIKNLEKFTKLGCPVLIGVSRKSFIGEITNCTVNERLSGTIAVNSIAINSGVKIIRVHDVKQCKKASLVIDEVRSV